MLTAKWVKKIIDDICIRFNGYLDISGGIRINNHILRVINDDELFSIKIVDLNRFTPAKQIDNIFCDDLCDILERYTKETV